MHSDVRIRRFCRVRRPSALLRVWAIAAVAVGVLAAASCTGDFHLSASNLEIGPDPAVPGDTVVATFLLSLIPTQSHTIIVMIDDTEHMRVTSDQAPLIPVILELGAAADLIAQYGTGDHTIYILVNANEDDERTRTQSVGFRLNAS
ncbi:MAG TPA: hypothetical protein VFZ24_08390 [Longimicrobiales bacterium]